MNGTGTGTGEPPSAPPPSPTTQQSTTKQQERSSNVPPAISESVKQSFSFLRDMGFDESLIDSAIRKFKHANDPDRIIEWCLTAPADEFTTTTGSTSTTSAMLSDIEAQENQIFGAENDFAGLFEDDTPAVPQPHPSSSPKTDNHHHPSTSTSSSISQEHQEQTTPADQSTASNKSSNTSKKKHILIELQRLFAQLQLSEQRAVSTETLTKSFGWNSNEVFQQHDVHELNR